MFMTEKEKYIELCDHNQNIPLFLRYYYLDAVNANWDVFLYEKNNKIIASYVYCIKSKYFLKYISMPKMTQYSGLWIDYDEVNRNEKRIALEEEVMNYFINKIEMLNIVYCFQSFSPQIKNYLPFYWKNYNETIKYTFVINEKEEEKIWNNMTSTLKNEIKKASKEAKLFYDCDSDLFYKYLCKTYERQNKNPSLSKEEFMNFDKIMREKKCVQIIGAKDINENIHSICYFVYDEKKVYYLMSANDYNFRKSNFNSLLVWEGIKFAIRKNLMFDFEGSMNKSINSFMRKFGGELNIYHCISKTITKNPIIKLLLNYRLKIKG